MSRKRLVIKTIIVTFSIVIILAVAAFGIVSLCAPGIMIGFSDSLGLTGISGDYAYQEYERTGSLECLARSFFISAERKNDRTADMRFELLYENEMFDDFCIEQNEAVVPEGIEGYDYRNRICGIAACVKYRLARSGDTSYEYDAIISFAFGETKKDFLPGNPVIAVGVEAIKAEDGGFCKQLLEEMRAYGFEQNQDFQEITKLLEECADE